MLDLDIAFLSFYNGFCQGSKSPWCYMAKGLSGYREPKGGETYEDTSSPVRDGVSD